MTSVASPEASGAGAASPIASRPELVLSLLRSQPFRRALVAISATAAGLLMVVWLGDLGFYNLPYAENLLPTLAKGLVVTLQLNAVVIPLGFTLGFFLGWARTTKSKLMRGIGAVYVEIFRGLPPIVLIFFSFLISTLAIAKATANPFIARDVSLWLGAVALSFHSGAYQTEIVRAGIFSVPAGQIEAAESIGMTQRQTMFLVTLPQAFRVSLPALGNEFASVIKDTSLLNVIGWLELGQIGILQASSAIRVDFNLVFIVWVEIALLYFVITFVVIRAVRLIENHFKVPGLEAAEL